MEAVQMEFVETAELDEAVQEVAAEMEAAFGEPEAEPTPAYVDARIDWTLERLGRLQAEQQRNREIANRRIAMITSWLDDANDRLGRQAFWLEIQVRSLAEGYDYGKKKSRTLPSGSFGKRAKPAGIEIRDMDAAIRWAKANGVEVAVVEKLNKTPAKEFVAKQLQTTGELPDPEETGIEWIDESETFFVKPTAGGV
jgi:phage host-nuclease inhibitor protein Gam